MMLNDTEYVRNCAEMLCGGETLLVLFSRDDLSEIHKPTKMHLVS